jgi:hypothetical protein
MEAGHRAVAERGIVRGDDAVGTTGPLSGPASR